MAKACVLPEQSPVFERLLATLSIERFARRPETFIIGMAYANRSQPYEQRATPGQIAQAVHEAFPDAAVVWTAQRIGKLVKSPELVLSDLQTSQQTEDVKAQTEDDATIQADPANWREKLQHAVFNTEKHGARLLLEGMEAGAYLRRDQASQKRLSVVNQELAGRENYRNGFLEAVKTPAKAQTKITGMLNDVRVKVDHVIQTGREREQRWKNRIGSAWRRVNFTIAAVAHRAQQDWQVAQTIATPKLHELVRNSPNDDQAQQVAVIARLQQMAER